MNCYTSKGHGDIIVTNSIAGHYPAYWEPVYSASKWAITSFMQGIRRQMIPYGVKVAQVSPGPVISTVGAWFGGSPPPPPGIKVGT